MGRIRVLIAAIVLVAGSIPATGAVAQPSTETLRVPVFGSVTVYRPAASPRQVVLFVSGDGGWNLGVIDMARRLRDAGAVVIGIDIRAFMKSLNASDGCAYPAGTLEDLSRAIQGRLGLPAYIPPILVGYSSGATLVYAALAAAPPETFAGAVSLGFCPDLEIQRPLCHMRGLTATKRAKGVGYDLSPYAASTVPWMVLQGEIDQVCDAGATRRFVAQTGTARIFPLPKVGHGFGVPSRWAPQFLEAYHAIVDARPAAAPRAAAPEVADLSLVEIQPREHPGARTMAIVLSGDGGWADIDKSLAAGFAAAGLPVVGWSSLGYYWKARTPGEAAADLGRIIQHYTRAWQIDQVLVVGYSFGADVAPFLVNRLSPAQRAKVRQVALLGPSENAAFEFHFANWFGGQPAAPNPTAPEIARLDVPVTCIDAEDEPASVCHHATAARLRTAFVGRGHHFSGEYARIVDAILR